MDKRYQYNEAFAQALRQLNPQQQRAVNQIDGPVMVIAGPGTGKTQVLTARIGNILLQTDTQPYEVLCLTFSETGVNAMQQRLLSWIGPEAYRIPISTFHAFAHKVIRENPHSFGGANLEVIDEIERSEVIRGIIDKLPHDHPLVLNAYTRYAYERHLAQLFLFIKQENHSVRDLLEKIDSYVKAIPSNPDFLYKRTPKKGQLKAEAHEEQKRMERLRAAVQLFPQYVQALRKIERYDFADMIRWVVEAFRQKQYLLRRYQERFLYFLVDEFQDTNGIQNELLNLLISYWDRPNVFVVGDDDQSIYEFQGARIKNITDFHRRYEDQIQLIVLEDNYRSKGEILQAAENVIRHNEIRLIHQQGINATKNLRPASSSLADLGTPVEILATADYTHQYAAILETIKKYLALGVPLSEMAIIYRKHKVADDITKLLELNDLEYELKRPANLLQEPVAIQVLRLIEYILAEIQKPGSGEHLAFEILSTPAFKIDPKDLIKINYLRNEEKIPWHRLLRDEEWIAGAGLRHPQAVTDFANLLDELMANEATMPVTEWLEKVINKAGFLAFAVEAEDRDWTLQCLFSLRQFFKQQVLKRSATPLSAAGILQHIRRLQDNHVALPVLRVQGREEGIKLLTSHSAKGLEFRLVIMPGCTDDWEKGRTNQNRFKLPDTITYSGSENQMEAERRLFYVSMTRAKEKLVILYPKTKTNGKPAQPSRFVAETELPVHDYQPRQETLHKVLADSLRFRPAPLVKTEDEEVRKTLENFVLSISSLNRYLECPVAFYYEYILKIPSEPSVSSTYGKAIHHALHKMVDWMRHSKDKTYPPVEVVIEAFRSAMNRSKGLFPPGEFEARMLRGENALHAYYNEYKDTWIDDAIAEYPVKKMEIDGVPIEGTIDRVDFIDAQTARIIDYKTGTPKPVTAPKKNNKIGSDYWRQLIFYAVLFQFQRPDSRRVVEGVVSFVEQDKKGRFIEKRFDIESGDKMLMRELIKDTWDQIQNRRFYEGCNKPECKWCNFHRTRQAPDSFRDEAIMGLDDE